MDNFYAALPLYLFIAGLFLGAWGAWWAATGTPKHFAYVYEELERLKAERETIDGQIVDLRRRLQLQKESIRYYQDTVLELTENKRVGF